MRHIAFTILAMAATVLLFTGTGVLAAEPGQGPPQPAWEKQIRSLIEQLGHDDFQRREAAQRALLREGPKILPVLDKLAPPADLEIQVRIRRIRYQLAGFLDDIRRRLTSLPEVQHESRPPIPEDLKRLIESYQPRSGDYLLSIIGQPDDKLHRRATNAFLHLWESMSAGQVQSYLHLALAPYAKLRPQYPQGVDAMIEMGYCVRYGWGGWPPEGRLALKTTTKHTLDGKAYGKPFSYEGPGAGTGWLRTKDLALGKHAFHLVTEYEFQAGGRTCSGRAASREYHFQVVAANAPNDLVAADDPEIDVLVRAALQFSEIRLEVRNGPIQIDQSGDVMVEQDPWEPQITWKSGDGRAGSLHMPLWKLTRELPVDLCFQVEFHLEGTGDVFEGDPLVVLKGKKQEGYFFPRDSVGDFAHGKTGLIPLRVVLKPSRALALTHTEVTRYYPGSITSQVLRAKAERR